MIDRSTIRVISFDGDGTLWDLDTAISRALEDASTSMHERQLRRVDGGAITPEWLRQVRDMIAQSPAFHQTSMEAIRRASFEEAISRCGIADQTLVQSLHDCYMATRRATLAAFPDVPQALAELNRHFRLVLVTNGNATPGDVGLGPLFDHVVVAFECGNRKPDPAIYREAMQRMATTPAEYLHVGDDPVEDVAATKSLGATSVWLNRQRRPWIGPITPDATIESLAELQTMLELP